MTIEEKAKEFAGFKHGVKENELAYAVRTLSYDGFKAGAEWMLKKAINWLNENADDFYMDDAQSDNCYYDVDEFMICFKKAMEEK